MGSPEFSQPILRSLVEKYLVVGVVTQPDRPAGRGRTVTPPPVKILAQELGLPFIQPGRLRTPEAMEQLHLWQPDLIVIAAFGQILRPEVLDMPRYGCINVHASLLPRWRGAAPIQAAILAGDDITGLTIMRMDAGIDTGPILNQAGIPISPDDTAGTLSNKMSLLGADLLVNTLPGYLSGETVPVPQDSLAGTPTYAPLLKKEDGLLDLSQPAIDLARRVRAFNPWPGAYVLRTGQILKIHRAHPVSGQNTMPGKTLSWNQNPAFGTGEGLLVLDEVQPAGKKPMPGEVFLRGARDWISG